MEDKDFNPFQRQEEEDKDTNPFEQEEERCLFPIELTIISPSQEEYLKHKRIPPPTSPNHNHHQDLPSSSVEEVFHSVSEESSFPFSDVDFHHCVLNDGVNVDLEGVHLFKDNFVVDLTKDTESEFGFYDAMETDLVLETEISVSQGKPRGDMTVEERIGAADQRKMDGDVLFQENKLEEAMQQYQMAIAYMGDDFMFQLFGKYRDMALAVKNPCHLNTAECLIKMNRYEEAIGQCTIVLSEDENNVKALFKRGKARAALGQTDAAREDFLKASKYAPEDEAIARELKLLAEHDKAIYQK